ncbi:MAG TPA: hypothetical protein VFZ67_04000 [Nitrososphaera sp.]
MNSVPVIGIEVSIDYHCTIPNNQQAVDINGFFSDSQQCFRKLGRIESFFLWCSSPPALRGPIGRWGDLFSNALQRNDHKWQHSQNDHRHVSTQNSP